MNWLIVGSMLAAIVFTIRWGFEPAMGFTLFVAAVAWFISSWLGI